MKYTKYEIRELFYNLCCFLFTYTRMICCTHRLIGLCKMSNPERVFVAWRYFQKETIEAKVVNKGKPASSCNIWCLWGVAKSFVISRLGSGMPDVITPVAGLYFTVAVDAPLSMNCVDQFLCGSQLYVCTMDDCICDCLHLTSRADISWNGTFLGLNPVLTLPSYHLDACLCG
jgi:hypothetical protein